VTAVTLEIIEIALYCCQLPIKNRQTVLKLTCGTGELTVNAKKLMIYDGFRRFLRIMCESLNAGIFSLATVARLFQAFKSSDIQNPPKPSVTRDLLNCNWYFSDV